MSSSIVPFAPTAFTLYRLKSLPPLDIVSVIVSALPESSDTMIDFTIAVVFAGHEYKVVSLVVVRSTLEFL